MHLLGSNHLQSKIYLQHVLALGHYYKISITRNYRYINIKSFSLILAGEASKHIERYSSLKCIFGWIIKILHQQTVICRNTRSFSDFSSRNFIKFPTHPRMHAPTRTYTYIGVTDYCNLPVSTIRCKTPVSAGTRRINHSRKRGGAIHTFVRLLQWD
jgi:hypothetical protein